MVKEQPNSFQFAYIPDAKEKEGTEQTQAFRYLPLKPLFFEVPQEEEQTYTQREWIYSAIENAFLSKSSCRGTIIHGGPGTGKDLK
jgi:hypothetical protein